MFAIIFVLFVILPSAAAVSLSCISAVTVTLTDGGFCTTLYHCVNTYSLMITWKLRQ